MLLFITIFIFHLFMHTRARCPPTGPVLPPPTNLTSLNLSNLTSSLHKLSQNETSLGWNSTTTSVSITLISANTTFFTYHHTAPLFNSSGVKLVDDNTIFRVASVTKVFTVLAVLLSEDIGIVMENKIGKFVEELNGHGRWKDITVGMLASQMSGAPREGTQVPFP
jgi:CubicO group peptidase (beta-lactamase class C family)